MTRKRPWVNRHPNALLTLYPYSNCFPGGVKRALHIERVTERMFVGCIKCSCEPTEVRLFVGRSKGDGSRTIHLPPVIYCAEHGVEFLRRLRKHEPDDMGYLKKMDEAIRLLEKAAHERAVQENAAD